MEEEKINRVLPLMFRRVKVPEKAKSELKERLFGGTALSDDDLFHVAAAGDLADLAAQERKSKYED